MCAMPSSRSVHDHEVTTRGPALAVRAAPALQRLVVERLEQRGPVDVDPGQLGARIHVTGRRRGLAASAAVPGARALGAGSFGALARSGLAASATTPPAPPLLGRVVGAGGRGRRARTGVAHAGRGCGVGARSGCVGARRRGTRSRRCGEPRVVAGLLGDVVVGQTPVGGCRRPVFTPRQHGLAAGRGVGAGRAARGAARGPGRAGLLAAPAAPRAAAATLLRLAVLVEERRTRRGAVPRTHPSRTLRPLRARRRSRRRPASRPRGYPYRPRMHARRVRGAGWVIR